FCRDCTRARLSAEGQLYTCLFATQGTDFRALLRGEASDDEVSQLISKVWTARSDRYSEIRTAETAKLRKVEMSYIGGGCTPPRLTRRRAPLPSRSTRGTTAAKRSRRRSRASIRSGSTWTSARSSP